MTAVALLLLASSDIGVSLTAAAPAVRLADAVTVTLTVTGPPPVRAECDGPDDDTAAGWKLTAAGPPVVAIGRWEQRFVADPFVTGEVVRVGLLPVRVWAGGAADPVRVPVPPLAVRVTADPGEATASAARPVTGPEDVPEPPPGRPVWGVVWVAGVAVGLVAVVGLVVAGLRRLKRTSPAVPVDPFAGLDGLTDAAFAHRMSEVSRKSLDAERLTAADLPPGPGRELLDRLDAVRFGGRPLTAADRTELRVAVAGLASGGRQPPVPVTVKGVDFSR